VNRLTLLMAAFVLVSPIAGCKNGIAGTATNSTVQLKTIPIVISTAEGKSYNFDVEVAKTPEEQARGLMFRESLPDFGGMIFYYTEPVNASFWMKNTVIPLDMLFIRTDGTIARIAAETVPYSLDQVPAGEPVIAVLEIAGGRSAKLGIKEGDRVKW
jgi:uncharacterized protein